MDEGASPNRTNFIKKFMHFVKNPSVSVWNQFYAQDMSGDRSQFGISLVSWIKY